MTRRSTIFNDLAVLVLGEVILIRVLLLVLRNVLHNKALACKSIVSVEVKPKISEKKLLVVCKVVLRTIILRDNTIREH